MNILALLAASQTPALSSGPGSGTDTGDFARTLEAAATRLPSADTPGASQGLPSPLQALRAGHGNEASLPLPAVRDPALKAALTDVAEKLQAAPRLASNREGREPSTETDTALAQGEAGALAALAGDVPTQVTPGPATGIGNTASSAGHAVTAANPDPTSTPATQATTRTGDNPKPEVPRTLALQHNGESLQTAGKQEFANDSTFNSVPRGTAHTAPDDLSEALSPQPVANRDAADAPTRATAIREGDLSLTASPATTSGSSTAPSSGPGSQGNPVHAGLTAPLASNQWQQQLGDQVTRMVQRGSGQVELQLRPAELGPLSVSLKVDDQGAQLQFLSGQSNVRTAVEQAIPQLREALAEQGINLGETTVGEQRHEGRGQDGFTDSSPGSGDAGSPGTDSEEATAIADGTPTDGIARPGLDVYA